MTEGGNEKKYKKPERHPTVPADAMVQRDVLLRYKGRINSLHTLNKLVEQCVAEGAPEPITPEDNAYKWGRWYPAALLISIDTKLEKRLPPAPPDWHSRTGIAKLLHLGVETVDDLADELESEAAFVNEQGQFMTEAGNPAKFYTPAFVEALRRRASQSRDRLRKPRLREKITPAPLPPPEHPDDLTEAERQVVAANDSGIVKALEGVHAQLQTIQAAIDKTPAHRIPAQMPREIQIARDNAHRYQSDIAVLSKTEMQPRILGLQRLVKRLHSNLRSIGVIEDDED